MKELLRFFIDNMWSNNYKVDPEIAYKISKIWGELILDIGEHISSEIEVAKYLINDMGLTPEESLFVISTLPNRKLRKEVRMEWDEEYAESQFMDYEDRGY